MTSLYPTSSGEGRVERSETGGGDDLSADSSPTLYILMGVSGCGKSSVGTAMAAATGLPFIEGDDHHPPDNVARMSSGRPLTNIHRKPWTAALAAAADAHDGDVILACSALNAQVRSWLTAATGRHCVWLHLSAPKTVIAARLATREDHFMDAGLLDSQFAALETEPDAIRIDIDRPLAQIVGDVTRIVMNRKTT